ncbi:SUKH-3 immunity protein [Nocardia amikacinitolerans]|uniref:SUKH-3 immunity protein n=1 Tax=Nocardia amikacinitolerans TaxID=756689 RepID=A0A285LAP3_9NOCA|nr:SUKH-3 domain-containing protein [Nocardia amikacinitolerans]SNY81107.1 SUKH-3 immunity protein [Nocardia amikacinitolerans]
MPEKATEQEVLDRLGESGWFPERDIGTEADYLIKIRVEDSIEQGFPLVPIEPAIRTIHNFGLLRINHPRTDGCALIFDPTARYKGDAEQINKLAQNLGFRLFPVGYEASEYGILLADESDRYFQLHHTGAYYMGENVMDMLSRFMGTIQEPDAEDFYIQEGND